MRVPGAGSRGKRSTRAPASAAGPPVRRATYHVVASAAAPASVARSSGQRRAARGLAAAAIATVAVAARRAACRERVRELLRAAPAIGGELGEGGEDGGLDVGRDGVAHGADGRDLLGEHAGDDGLHARARERRVAGEHLVEHGAQGVDVGAGVDGLLAHGLLGAHVVRGAEGEAGLGHAGAAGLLHGEGDAEVGDEGLALVQQDVLGLDVAVDDALAVGVVEGAGDFGGEADGVGDGEHAFAREAGAQRLAGDERHDVVEQAVGVAAVEQREDVRMLQARGGADLAEEAFAAEGGAEVGMEDLDGDVALVLEVVGEVDGGHAALAEFALEAVAVRQGRGEAIEGRGHGCTFVESARRSRVGQCCT